MNKDPAPDCGDPSESESQTNAHRWKHNHAFFVLAVLTRYKIRIYKHKKVHTGKIGDGIESWNAEDECLAIEEGRRQLQGQFNELQYVTTRASVLLTIATAAAIYFLTGLDDLGGIAQPWQWIARFLLLAGSASALWGALVMGALIGDRAPFKQTDAVQLTGEPGNLRRYLARDYADNVPTGVDTNAARLTHLGTGVIWITLGALFGVIGLTISALSVTPGDPPDQTHAIKETDSCPSSPTPSSSASTRTSTATGRAASFADTFPRSTDTTTCSLRSGLRSDGLAIIISLHQTRT